jgi:hypothetical protein
MLKELSKKMDEHRAEDDRIFSQAKEWFQTNSDRINSIEQWKQSVENDRNKVVGGAVVLQTIGGFVVTIFIAIGWFTVHGVPAWIKEALH